MVVIQTGAGAVGCWEEGRQVLGRGGVKSDRCG